MRFEPSKCVSTTATMTHAHVHKKRIEIAFCVANAPMPCKFCEFVIGAFIIGKNKKKVKHSYKEKVKMVPMFVWGYFSLLRLSSFLLALLKSLD